ncbi:hypothetical protein ABPG75_011264 [Micractinium tetrahymenae]
MAEAMALQRDCPGRRIPATCRKHCSAPRLPRPSSASSAAGCQRHDLCCTAGPGLVLHLPPHPFVALFYPPAAHANSARHPRCSTLSALPMSPSQSCAGLRPFHGCRHPSTVNDCRTQYEGTGGGMLLVYTN